MSGILISDLLNIELLAGFQPDELEQFTDNLTVREVAAGDMVFSAGEESRALFLILSGQVQIELTGIYADETPLAVLGPRDVFGESTFFHAAAHTTTARCLEATRLAEFSYERYESLLKSKAPMAYHLGANAAHILAARLQQTDQWVRELLDHDEQIHRSNLRAQYRSSFRPSFATPHGFAGLGVNW